MSDRIGITYQTTLSTNIVLLCRFLRTKGFTLSTTDECNALNALLYIPMQREQFFVEALKTVLSKNQYQFQIFETLYKEFKIAQAKEANSKIKELPEAQTTKSAAQQKEEHFENLKDWLGLNQATDEKAVAASSAFEVLSKKSFSDLDEEEVKRIMHMLQKMARRIRYQKSRLKKKSRKHQQLDLKNTIRFNLRKGSEIQQLRFSEKKTKRLKLVLLCDVSKSMDLYSRFFIHLIYAFQQGYHKIETFVFSTALHKVTDILNNHSFNKAFSILSERVPQWSGGTTIGQCLDDFVEDYSYRLLDRKTVVYILSDGWDTGDTTLIETAMKHIYKKSRKVLWLNPLAGNPDFSPQVLGLKAALPYIDQLLPAHNLESLKHALRSVKQRRNLQKNQFLY